MTTADIADALRELAPSIFLLVAILGFMRMDRRIKQLERIVENLNEENQQKALIEKAELRELVNKATEEKE